jgi:RNA polymerase sigma-70 factor (ECF subfamily)
MEHDWSDEDLLHRTPRAPSAFEAFYLRHETAVVAYFMNRTRDAELTADLAAETFAAALIGAKKYNKRHGPAVAWLFGIARHRWLRALERGRVEDRARRKLGMPQLVLDDEVLERIAATAGDERVERLLAQLPGEQAAAIEQRVLEERPYSEIASGIGCSEAVVRKRVSRGLATLRGIAEGEA